MHIFIYIADICTHIHSHTELSYLFPIIINYSWLKNFTFSDKLGNDDEDKVSVVSDLESIITFYCKNRGKQYERGNGWLELLGPLIALKLPRSATYNLFEAIRDIYIPRYV